MVSMGSIIYFIAWVVFPDRFRKQGSALFKTTASK